MEVLVLVLKFYPWIQNVLTVSVRNKVWEQMQVLLVVAFVSVWTQMHLLEIVAGGQL